MFLVDKLSMLNIIAKGTMEQYISKGSISMMNILDEKSLDKMAKSAEARLWKCCVTFGSASADILAVFIIAPLIKLIIDTIIHGHALHSIYGCDIYLLITVWSSVDYLLFHLGKSIKTGQTNQNKEHQEIETCSTEESRSRFPQRPKIIAPLINCYAMST
ncbi:hypothetical protein HN011_000960 [Eciton burchellii]|nr:hypothetical protein HN011_000960 [Eciton burchellii]